MEKSKQIIRHLYWYWIDPIISLRKIFQSISLYRTFLSQWSEYNRKQNVEDLHFLDSYPMIYDRTIETPFDAHYFYQAVWATQRIIQNAPNVHLDLGSDNRYVGLLTTHLPVFFLDIRPLNISLPNFYSITGDVLSLPISSGSINSISSLHVVEHIGLGRYGDSLNPRGTEYACRELSRILSPSGNLYISLPVGIQRTCFNAHRIHDPLCIYDLFPNLKLVEFSAVDDKGKLHLNTSPELLKSANHACGLYWLKK